MSDVRVDIVRLAHGRDLPLPGYATADSAGMDLLSAEDGDVILAPGKRAMVCTGNPVTRASSSTPSSS